MTVSVIVPVLAEQETVARAIESARRVIPGCEVIVVDGGSRDRTVERARAAGARVLEQPGTRADAMNAGAAASTGRALLFLHADTTLPDGAAGAIATALAAAPGGAFRLGFDDRPRFWRIASRTYARLHRGAYGDQAIFLSRAAFDALGGYRALPIMEDYDLVRRLRRLGDFRIVPLSVRVSARRHRRHGELRTFVRISVIKALYRLGVPPALLARAYPPAR